MFSCEFCEIFKNIFSYRTPLVTAFLVWELISSERMQVWVRSLRALLNFLWEKILIVLFNLQDSAFNKAFKRFQFSSHLNHNFATVNAEIGKQLK